MEETIQHVVSEFGYAGIFLMIALENVFPPIPSEVILTFGGFMTTSTDLRFAGVVAASTMGSIIGAIVLYYFGYWMEASKVERFVERWGRFLRLTASDVRKAYGWFSKYETWAVFLCRFVPLLRSLISIPAGSARMNMGKFLLLTALGSLIWNAALIGIGAAVGAQWETIVAYMDTYSTFVYSGVAILGMAVVYLMIRRKAAKER
ncbi:DedA family protein [Paenibacillus aurantiacus]|uniref:DedA family protein n=1 Tax=Paenibacillus aurantiacus TaxID=1936118 RepID=A0ABV5KU72_9BACL